MMDAVEGELRQLSETANEPSGELRLTLPSVLSLSEITDKLAAFSLEYPRIELTVDFSETRRSLIDDRFDLAIRMGPIAKKSATIRKLLSVKRVLVASKDYLSGRKKLALPKETLEWEWLALAPVQKSPLKLENENTGEVVQIKPKPHMFTNDVQALHRLARAGAGLAIVPEFLVAEDIEAGRMVLVLPEWELPPITVFAEWPANAPKNGLIHLALNRLSTDRRPTS